MKQLFTIAIVTIVSVLGIMALQTQVSALSGKDFNPGRIIDDAVFYNSNSMTVEQIQNFLNSKMKKRLS